MFGGCLALHRATYVQDPIPLTEYYSRTLKDYKGLTWDQITPQSASKMLRVTSLSNEDFQQLVREGYPFIVDDCAPAAELAEVPCSEFGRKFPKEHMKAEYTEGQAHINLGDPEWYSVQKPTESAPKHLSRGKPLSGPYIWHVKDETVDPRTKPELAKVFPVPYFLNNSALNAHEARDSFEFWFVLENGGSQAHSDSYCETTISLQLRGTKKWRLGAFPNISNAFQPSGYFDGQIYKNDEFWRPEHEETVEPGQCVVFPMGYIHETYIAEGGGGEDGCSVATTFQFQEPQPVFLWKNFLVRWGLSHFALEEPCMDRMVPYFYLAQRRYKGSDEGKLRAQCAKVFKKLDTDKDGMLRPAEFKAYFDSTSEPVFWEGSRVNKEALQQATKEKFAWQAEDALLLHDHDRDGAVSLEEFEESVLKFHAVDHRTKYIKKLKRHRDELLKEERKWIREHLCLSEDCPQLARLERDYEKRRKRRKRHQEL